MPLRLAFVIDPIESLLPDKDTTFVFMLEALARGHAVYTLSVNDIVLRDGIPSAAATRTEVRRPRKDESHYHLGETRHEPLTWFDAVFMRKDPPFDMHYYFATHFLGLVDPDRTLVLNNPRGLREANEKLYALRFPSLTPPSLVTADPGLLKEFMDTHDGEMILKPLDGCGGMGVFHLRRGDRNLNAVLEMSTDQGRRPVMAQKYLPEARRGDKRLLVLDGEPIGAVLRVPREDETRGNIHVGGVCEKAPIDERDREICAVMAPRLKKDGLFFVGLDVIGGWVTEVNVTSPTGIQEANALDGTRLEARVLDFVETRVVSQKKRQLP